MLILNDDDIYIINCLELIALNYIQSCIQYTPSTSVYTVDMHTLFPSFCEFLDNNNIKYVDYIDNIKSFNKFEKEIIYNEFINYKSQIINIISIV